METLQLKETTSSLFGIQISTIKKLSGYDNENYLLKCGNKKKYILKKYNFSKENLSLIQAENHCLEYLNKHNNSYYPEPIYSSNKKYCEIIKNLNNRYIIRILSYLEGTFLGEIKPKEIHLEAIGSFIGNLNKQLRNYSNHCIAARKSPWDIQYLSLNKKYLKYISDPGNRKIVFFFIQQFEEFVLPKLNELRKSIIHNDTNEWNILLKNKNKVCIIDFGDLAETQLVNEVAISMVYASYSNKNPLQNASSILKSYNKVIELTDKEISLLYYLMAAKLCISVCNSAYSRKKDPSNKYALISEKNAWKMLRFLVKTSPEYVENTFREVLNKKKEI